MQLEENFLSSLNFAVSKRTGFPPWQVEKDSNSIVYVESFIFFRSVACFKYGQAMEGEKSFLP